MIAGKGVKDDLIKQETIDSISLDLKLQGGYDWEIILTIDGTDIAQVNHLPFESMRLEKSDDFGKIHGAWFSKDWLNKQKNKPKRIPKWDQSVLSMEENENRRFVHWGFLPTPGSWDYPAPDYEAAIDYIELDKLIGIFHNSNLQNGMFPSVIVNFRNDDPGEEIRKAMLKDMSQNLVGPANTSRIWATWTAPTDEAPVITSFQPNDADKMFDLVSALASEKIITAHKITSPLIVGKRPPSGFGSNKEEMETATNLFMLQVVKPYQKMITDDLEEILGRTIVIEPNVLTFQVAAEPQKAALSAEVIEMDANDSKFWIEHLEKVGEVVDMDEWELYGEADVIDSDGERAYNQTIAELTEAKLFSEYADPDAKSEIDTGLFKVRYQYTGRTTAKSRDFCTFMMQDSRAGTVYRIEDIDAMSFNGVNGQFAPAGSSSYSILDHKGGVYCHHKWKRLVFKRKREKGKFLPNDGLNNDELSKERPRT